MFVLTWLCEVCALIPPESKFLNCHSATELHDVDLFFFCLIFQIVMMERLMAQTGATPENVAKVSRTQSESKAGPECPVVSKGTFIILIVCLHFGQFHFQI